MNTVTIKSTVTLAAMFTDDIKCNHKNICNLDNKKKHANVNPLFFM